MTRYIEVFAMHIELSCFDIPCLTEDNNLNSPSN